MCMIQAFFVCGLHIDTVYVLWGKVIHRMILHYAHVVILYK